MSETTNYGLFVSNDDQMTFREWRLKLSGETESNMTKIDEALASKTGKNVEGSEFIIDGEVVAANNGAEIFNNYKLNIATGAYSHAEGLSTKATSSSSHAEGLSTKATGQSSHAEGASTEATGSSSHAEGFNTVASGSRSHAEGASTEATGTASHAEGLSTVASGSASHAEGHETQASGDYSHSEGESTVASGESSHAEGGTTISSGAGSHAEGIGSTSSGDYSHAEGLATDAVGDGSHTQGWCTYAPSRCMDVIGRYNLYEELEPYIEERRSNEGSYQLDDYIYVFSESNFSISDDGLSFNIKHSVKTLVSDAISDNYIGYYYTPSLENNTTYVYRIEGYTEFSTGHSFNITRFKIVNPTEEFGEFVHVIGNGNYEQDRSNAHTVTWTGEAWYAGDVYVGSTSGTNKDEGSVKLVTEKELADAISNIEVSGGGGVGRVGSGGNSAVFNNYDLNIASGDYSHAEGSGTESSNLTSHAEGFATRASSMASHSEGSGTEASGMAAHSEGTGSVASGGSAHAEGSNTKAYGMFSHTEGNATEAVNENSHAQGLSTKATGRSTDVIGEFNKYEDAIEKIANTRYFDSSDVVRWVYVFSESDYTISDDKLNFIVSNSVLTKLLSLKAGDYYVSSGDGSYTEIKKCNSISSVSYGSSSECSIDYTSYTIASQSKDRGSFAHIVGNGTSEDTRSNAHTLDWNGNAWFAGDVYVKSTSGKNRDNGSLRLVTTEDLAEVASASGSVVWGSF